MRNDMEKENQFMECDTCREKAGTPTLCYGCLHNRSLIEKLLNEVEGRIFEFVVTPPTS